MTEPKTFQEAAYLAAKETADLVIKKQKDYGPSNIVALGELGIFVRLWDKINRLLTLLWRPLLAGQSPQEAQNEPAEDTWDDIPGYCLCRKMLKRGWFELPMEEKINLDNYKVIRDTQTHRCSLCGRVVTPQRHIETVLDDDGGGHHIEDWSRCPACQGLWRAYGAGQPREIGRYPNV